MDFDFSVITKFYENKKKKNHDITYFDRVKQISLNLKKRRTGFYRIFVWVIM